MTSEKQFNADKYYDLTATITSGQTDSNIVDLQGLELVGIFVPSTFDGTTLTLQTAPAIDGTFVAVQDGYGTDVSIIAAASKYIAISNLSLTAGIRFLKLSAGTAQSGTDTIFTLAFRAI